MSKITVKYEGRCSKCSEYLEVGTKAMYERKTGIFCIGCEPTDTEEIRAYRQDIANRKADKYDQWAEKRREDASRVLKHTDQFTGDIAFNTQPGHIPFRARIIKQQDKAYSNIQTAKRFEQKARNLRHVRVQGDAEKKRQEQREFVLSRIKVGDTVDSPYGIGKVAKINKKTVLLDKGDYKVKIDVSFICTSV